MFLLAIVGSVSRDGLLNRTVTSPRKHWSLSFDGSEICFKSLSSYKRFKDEDWLSCWLTSTTRRTPRRRLHTPRQWRRRTRRRTRSRGSVSRLTSRLRTRLRSRHRWPTPWTSSREGCLNSIYEDRVKTRVIELLSDCLCSDTDTDAVTLNKSVEYVRLVIVEEIQRQVKQDRIIVTGSMIAANARYQLACSEEHGTRIEDV